MKEMWLFETGRGGVKVYNPQGQLVKTVQAPLTWGQVSRRAAVGGLVAGATTYAAIKAFQHLRNRSAARALRAGTGAATAG